MSVAVFSAPQNPPRLGDAVPVVALGDLDREQWKAWRRRGIGGSDAAAICGLSPWSSAFTVWATKVGLVAEDDADETEAMRWGRLLEDVVATEVEYRTPELTLFPVHEMVACSLRPWQLANIDRGAVVAGETGIYEGKTTSAWGARDWDDDAVPDRVLLQGMHYLAVTGLPWVIFAVLIGGQRLEVRRVERDQDLVDHLVAIETEFWDHVTSGEPPPPDGSRATTEVLGHLWDVAPESVVTLDAAEVEPLIAARRDAIDAERRAGLVRAEAENRLKALAGEHEVAVDAEGRKLFTWKAQTRRSVNVADLRRAMYDVADELSDETVCRILRVTKGVA